MMLRLPLRGDAVSARMAARELALHKGRSALVVLLVAVPVMVVMALGVFANQASESSSGREFGQATFTVQPLDGRNGTCVQSQLAYPSCDDEPVEGATPKPALPDFSGVAELKRPGHREYHRPATIRIDGVLVERGLGVVELANPLAAERWLPEHPGQQPAAGEVLVHRELWHRFGLASGAVIEVDGKPHVVAGWIRSDDYNAGVVVGPQHPLAAGIDRAAGVQRTDYLHGDEPTMTQVHQLNRQGVGVVTRGERAAYNSDDSATIMQAILLLVLLVATLLTATIAGAAFSIGIRQQRRSLALLGASGAPGSVLQRVVVRQGLLLGVLGSAVGVVSGLALGALAQWWVERASSDMPQPFRLPWLLLLVVCPVVGVAASVAAAWLPARRIAHQDVLDAVRDAETTQDPARLPRLGVLLLALGVVVGVVGPRLWPSGRARYDGTVPVETVIGPGAICVLLLFLAALLAMPWLLDQLGRRARGPLGWRLALRDGSRNRARATATVAASMAISSLAGLLLVANQSMGQTELDHYQYLNRPGVGEVGSVGDRTFGEAQWQAVRSVVEPVVPIIADAPMREPQVCAEQADGQPPACSNPVMVMGPETCEGNECSSSGHPARLYSDELFALLAGRTVKAEEKAVIERGGVLGPTGAVPKQRAVIQTEGASTVEQGVAAMPVSGATGNWVLIGEQSPVVKQLKAKPVVVGRAVELARVPSTAETQKLMNVFAAGGSSVEGLSFGVEQGPTSEYLDTQRPLALISAGLMLVVAALTGALALRDARPAHAGLAAIGGSTRTLRAMAAVQTLVSVGLGSLLGLFVGVLPMVLMVLASRGGVSLGIPWGWLTALLVAVPVVASLAAFLLVRPPAPRAVRVD